MLLKNEWETGRFYTRNIIVLWFVYDFTKDFMPSSNLEQRVYYIKISINSWPIPIGSV